MYLKRPNNNNRNSLGSCSGGTCRPSSSKLFQPGVKIIVQRAPLFSGLSLNNVATKKFQRPMLKRRAYNANADQALRCSSLGQRKRMDGMSKLLARAGKGLTYKMPFGQAKKGDDEGDSQDEDEDDNNKTEAERPFEPLRLWTSPQNGGEPKGLPPTRVQELKVNEYGIEEMATVVKPAPENFYSKNDVFVPPVLAKWLRPHQREGVQFMYECVMGLKEFQGNGCILADDMGLGKTLQSVTLIYTLLKTGITANGAATAKRVIVICPCSLVKNWENEFVKWLGPGVVKTLAIAEADRSTVEKNLDAFVRTKLFNVLIASYECIRAHVGRLIKHADCCDLLVCDEAHRLKNRDNQTARALNSLPVKRRVLLTGTPMQNDLEEFYAMVDFTNSNILGTPEEFRRYMMAPILRGREPDATPAQKQRMIDRQSDMSIIVNDFILRRVNTLNAEHLPPKLVQVVCCNLTDIQQNMYQHLVSSKDMQHVLNGKQVNCLGSIQMLMKLCNHPSLICEEDDKKDGATRTSGRRTAGKKINYNDEEKETSAAPGAEGISKYMPANFEPSRRGFNAPVHPEWSGKMFVLFRLMREMRKPGNGNDKIVVVSNYTQTLDLIGRMCRENSWGFCRLDGSIGMKKRQKMVDDFNDPSTSLIAFLLSSKAGGCGLNLIGGNRLVLFDPDWNPAVDKQAAARCWRDGQKKRCFTYRFLATGTVEEKIFQRQLSKEGLQSVVDDKEQVNTLSTKDLRNLFKLRSGTPSDTHDKLRCERCDIIHDNAEMEALKKLPKQLVRCRELLDEMVKEEDAAYFLKPMNPQDHGMTTQEYEKIVKQPMDFGTIRTRLAQALATLQQNLEQRGETAPSLKTKQSATANTYQSVSAFSKDVNRIFSNCLKVWEPERDAVAGAARRLQTWWVEQWTSLVPILMTMKMDDDEKKAPHGSMKGDAEADDILDTIDLMKNERGENFQEQIGMPDEENMRDWSHHYSTDTVDDPVFRAAMRGFDSVSFVFGLEVTWSLIQQRKQEEEERRVMEELQAADELTRGTVEAEDEAGSEGAESELHGDGDRVALEESSDDEQEVEDEDVDEDVDAEVDADESPEEDEDEDEDVDEDVNVEVDADDSPEEDEEDVDEEESQIDEDATEKQEPEGDSNDVDPKETSLNEETEIQEDDESEEETRPGQENCPLTVASSESEVDSEIEDAQESPKKQAASPGRGKENEAPKKGMWTCEVCTYAYNDRAALLCETCDSAKPSPKKKQRRRA